MEVTRMKWAKVNDRCIQCGDFLIARYSTLTGDVYGLTRKGKSIGYYLTAGEAKQAAKDCK